MHKARKWVDEELKKVYEIYADNTPRLKDYPGLRKLLREDYSTVIGSYKEILLRQITPKPEVEKDEEQGEKMDAEVTESGRDEIKRKKDRKEKNAQDNRNKDGGDVIFKRLTMLERKMDESRSKDEE